MKELANALQGFADGFGNTVAPQSYQNAVYGRQTRAMGNALAEGDFGAAQKQAFQMGDVGTGMQLMQYQDERKAAEQQQMSEREQQFLQKGVALTQQLLTIPAERRAETVATNWPQISQMLGLGPEVSFEQFANDPNAFSDEGLQEDLAIAQAQLGMGPSAGVEGKVVNNRLVNPMTGQVIGDFSDPQGPLSSAGKLYADLQAGRITPQQFEAEMQGASNRGTSVNVYSGAPSNNRPLIDKPPKGLQYTYDEATGSYVATPIPGADQSNEQIAAGSAARNKIENALSRTQLISDTIDRAIEQSNALNTGPIMGRNPLASNIENTLRTIQANIGFAELNKMREESPTGGALGQVTEKEIAFLQSVLGSIERVQSEAQLDATLQQVKREINNSFQRMQQAYQQDMQAGLFGPSQAAPQALGGNGPQAGTVEDGYRFKGGDPSNPANWERAG